MDDELRALLDKIPLFKAKAVRLTPLGGGITNRNYRVDAGEESFVLRIGGESTGLLGIDRTHEHASSSAAAAAGVGPEVIAFLPEHRAMVTRFVGGTVLTAEQTRQPDIMRRMVEALRHFHTGSGIPGTFSAFAVVARYYILARERSVVFPRNISNALDLLACLEEKLPTGEPLYPCHNDLLPSNLIDDGTSVRIIDWEYAGMGDRFFDLGNLAANHQYNDADEDMLVAQYFGEAHPQHRERLRLMRLVSDMREAMWGFLQTGIGTLDFDYAEYGRRHLNRFLQGCARAGIEPESARVTMSGQRQRTAPRLRRPANTALIARARRSAANSGTKDPPEVEQS